MLCNALLGSAWHISSTSACTEAAKVPTFRRDVGGSLMLAWVLRRSTRKSSNIELTQRQNSLRQSASSDLGPMVGSIQQENSDITSASYSNMRLQSFSSKAALFQHADDKRWLGAPL